MRVIRGGRVLTPDGWLAGGDVGIDAGRIAAIGIDLAGEALLDARDLLVLPGFVDLHVHGAGGAQFEEGTLAAARQVLEALARLGTTSALATLAALPPDALLAAAGAIAAARDGGAGARLLGIHLEGPFLSPRHAGAQNPDWMRPPSLRELEAVQAACGGLVRLVTVAPELPGALEFIAAARRRGVRVALGHSEAAAGQVEAAVAAGATQVTHLFNAMPSLHHRTPGLVGVALADGRLAVELIADGVHVDARAVRLAARCKGQGGVLLVSDGVAAGAPPGPLHLFGAACIAGDAVRRADDGRLAGSCLTLPAAVRNLRAWLPEWAEEDILAAASAVPARALGECAADAGVLALGAPADVVLLDRQWGLRHVLRAGRIVR